MPTHLLAVVADPEVLDALRALRRDDLQVAAWSPGQVDGAALRAARADLVVVDRAGLRALRSLGAGGVLDPGRSELFHVVTDESGAERDELERRGFTLLDAAGTGAHAPLLRAVARRRSPPLAFGEFSTASPALAALLETARRVSATDATVLLLGETGVGKERLAAAIHAQGARRGGPFVAVNCGAIPESLLESELFGHEHGAFTGADRERAGYFELAAGGTLFLDEVGELPPHLQVKLLRALPERPGSLQVQRVGGAAPVSVDARLVAATNRDLVRDVEAGRFRRDLYYRLSVVTLTVPPLRERPEDIPFLVRHYVERLAAASGSAVRQVSPAAMEALCGYGWPGNVREVINVVERAVILATGDEVTLADLPEHIATARMPEAIEALIDRAAAPLSQLDEGWFRLSLREARRAWNAAFERIYLERVLRDTHGRVGRAAARIGIDPRSLYTKLRAHGIRKEDYRG